MQFVRASVKTLAFVIATLGNYSIWFLGRPFVKNKIRWRQRMFGSWTSYFIWISGMKLRVVGTAPTPPFFLVCNHLSYTDIAALRKAVNGVFVAKAEIKGWPVAGRIIRDMGTVFVDRGNRRDIPRAGEEISQRLDAGEGVIVFPEGTSTSGDGILPFNSSFLQFPAERGLPVSYASITYATPNGSPPASTAVCWGEDISFFKHLFKHFELSGYTATITFGDAAIRGSDRKLLARELHDHVEATFAPVL